MAVLIEVKLVGDCGVNLSWVWWMEDEYLVPLKQMVEVSE